MGTLAALLLVFLSTVIGWPLGSLINRLRKRTSTAPPASRRARWVAGIVSLLNLIFIVVIVISVGPQFVFGVPTIVVGALAIPILTGSLTLVMQAMTALAWKDGYWSTQGRIHYSLIALAALIFIWWTNYLNLSGWRFSKTANNRFR